MSNDEHPTPDKIFKALDKYYKFKLDAAATAKNTKCKKYFTKEDDALSKNWITKGYVWLNPPYSKKAGGIKKWLYKAEYESDHLNCKGVVCLVPADVSTQYFSMVWEWASEIVFLTPRIAFEGSNNGAKFSSMLVIFDLKREQNAKVSLWNWKYDFKYRL